MVGLDDLKGLFQPKQFYDSMILYMEIFHERMNSEFLKTYELLRTHWEVRSVLPSANGNHWLHV